MAVQVDNCKKYQQIQHEYKHRLFHNNLPTPGSFSLSIPFQDYDFSWNITYTLTRRINYQNNYIMSQLDLNLAEKPTIEFTAFISIKICETTLDFRFDSKNGCLPKSTSLNITNILSADNNPLIFTVTLLVEDNSIDLVLKNYSKFLNNEKLSDVTIVIKEEKFPAHVDVLSEHSKVFTSMFESDMLEKKNGQVKIDDIEPNIFKLLLDYIYYARIKSKDIKDWLALIVIADKYAIESLVKICEHYVSKNLTAENVVDVFTISDLVKAEDLKKNCVKFIVKNKAVVLKTDGYRKLVKTRTDLVSEMFSYIMLCCSLTLEE